MGLPGEFLFQGSEYRVVACSGPERIETGWWRGPRIRRDYFRVETTESLRFWLFRVVEKDVVEKDVVEKDVVEEDRWFLQGEFF